jgi:hypothetical protein
VTDVVNVEGGRDPVLRSLLVDKLAEGAHEGMRRYAAGRGLPDVPPWDDLGDDARNLVRAAITRIFTRLASTIDELRAEVGP